MKRGAKEASNKAETNFTTESNVTAENNKSNTQSSKGFPREKILTISAIEYCESVGKQLTDYELVGVHAIALTNEAVPIGTEVIAGYRLVYGGGKWSWEYGTALVPREKR